MNFPNKPRTLMKILKIAALDPGLRQSGYAVLNYDPKKNQVWASNCGIARVHPKITGLEALMVMIENLRAVFSKNSFSKCDKIIVEFPSSPFGSKFGGGIIP